MDPATARRWLELFAAAVAEHRDELTALDSAIGDADHGSNLDRGMAAVLAAPTDGDGDASTVLKQAGMTLIRTVGGASGPLYGTFFLRVAAGSLDGDASLAAALRAGLAGLQQRGKAELGDKTMIDALSPALDALDGALADGRSLEQALQAAAMAAGDGRDATTPLVARKGRASYLGERSAGHQDPGATSMALLVTALAGASEPASASESAPA